MTPQTDSAPGAFGLTPDEMKRFVRNHFNAFVNGRDSSQAERSFSDDFWTTTNLPV